MEYQPSVPVDPASDLALPVAAAAELLTAAASGEQAVIPTATIAIVTGHAKERRRPKGVIVVPFSEMLSGFVFETRRAQLFDAREHLRFCFKKNVERCPDAAIPA